MVHELILIIKISDAFSAFESHPFFVHVYQRPQVYFTVRDYGILILGTWIVLFFHLKFNLTDWWNPIVFVYLLLRNILSWHLIAHLWNFHLRLVLIKFSLARNNFIHWICYIFKLASFLLLLKRSIFYIVVFLNVGIKTIFYFILWTTWNFFWYLWPLWTYLRKQLNNFSIFLICPFFFFYFWVQFINESLSDLLASFSTYHLGKELPVLANFFNNFFNSLIFFGRPYFSICTKLWQSPISMKALILISVNHFRGNVGPSFGIFLIKFD